MIATARLQPDWTDLKDVTDYVTVLGDLAKTAGAAVLSFYDKAGQGFVRESTTPEDQVPIGATSTARSAIGLAGLIRALEEDGNKHDAKLLKQARKAVTASTNQVLNDFVTVPDHRAASSSNGVNVFTDMQVAIALGSLDGIAEVDPRHLGVRGRAGRRGGRCAA